MPWLIFASPTKKRDVFYFYCQVIWVALASCTFCLPNKMAIQDIIRTISQSWFNLDLCFIANLIVQFSWLSKATILIELPNFRRSFNIWRFIASTESWIMMSVASASLCDCVNEKKRNSKLWISLTTFASKIWLMYF